MLSGEQGARRSREALRASVEKLRAQLERYEALCAEIGQSPADVALGWTLANPVVTAPIIGPRTIEQLEQNVAALDLPFDADLLRRLDEIWPGPGGEAPEAYAW